MAHAGVHFVSRGSGTLPTVRAARHDVAQPFTLAGMNRFERGGPMSLESKNGVSHGVLDSRARPLPEYRHFNGQIIRAKDGKSAFTLSTQNLVTPENGVRD